MIYMIVELVCDDVLHYMYLGGKTMTKAFFSFFVCVASALQDVLVMELELVFFYLVSHN